MPIAGLILAGGRSSRMGGGDKTLLDLAGRPMLAHIVDRFGPQVDRLALSANGDPARFAAFGLPVLGDGAFVDAGPLAGILAGLDWAAELKAERLVSVAGDTPFLPRDLVGRLLAATPDTSAIAMAASGGARHPVFAAWPTSLRESLREFLAAGSTYKVTHFADGFPLIVVDFPTEPVDPFFNVNLRSELVDAEAILARGGP